jgi:hypothetical protein
MYPTLTPGRGLKSAENFQIMFKLADTIGAAGMSCLMRFSLRHRHLD